MSKSNPFVKARTIASNVVMWILIVIAALGFSAILIGSIVRGFIEGLPWYETFAFPLVLLIVTVAMFAIVIASLYLSHWWKGLEYRWEKKHHG